MALYENKDWLVVVEEIASGWVKTTYIWVGIAEFPNNQTLAQLKALPIWKINKFVETTSGGTVSTDEFQTAIETTIGNWFFTRTSDPIFVWNNRASLTYL